MLEVSPTDDAARQVQIDRARTQAAAGNLEPLRELKAAYDKLDLNRNTLLALSALSVVDLWMQYRRELEA